MRLHFERALADCGGKPFPAFGCAVLCGLRHLKEFFDGVGTSPWAAQSPSMSVFYYRGVTARRFLLLCSAI